jgi:hypothetical protein
MIHGLLFWLDERVSRNIGPLISRCGPDLRCMLSGPPVSVVRTTGSTVRTNGLGGRGLRLTLWG